MLQQLFLRSLEHLKCNHNDLGAPERPENQCRQNGWVQVADTLGSARQTIIEGDCFENK